MIRLTPPSPRRSLRPPPPRLLSLMACMRRAKSRRLRFETRSSASNGGKFSKRNTFCVPTSSLFCKSERRCGGRTFPMRPLHHHHHHRLCRPLQQWRRMLRPPPSPRLRLRDASWGPASAPTATFRTPPSLRCRSRCCPPRSGASRHVGSGARIAMPFLGEMVGAVAVEISSQIRANGGPFRATGSFFWRSATKQRQRPTAGSTNSGRRGTCSRTSWRVMPPLPHHP